jgi:hypothetical protein|nr:hypothetical protein [uncultured Oscillibacter sp.]
MDEYLDCLFHYVLDHMHVDARLDLIDYSRCNAAEDMAWKALEKALTSEQLNLVEDYKAALSGLRFLEDQLLFEKAVSLGKWMTRP